MIGGVIKKIRDAYNRAYPRCPKCARGRLSSFRYCGGAAWRCQHLLIGLVMSEHLWRFCRCCGFLELKRCVNNGRIGAERSAHLWAVK
jgi:hypothetical protein